VKYCSFDVKKGPLILKFSIFMLPELLSILEAFCFWVIWRSTCDPWSWFLSKSHIISIALPQGVKRFLSSH